MKKMKRAFLAVILLLVIAMNLVACGKKECEFCGEKTKCKTINLDGDKIYICKSCVSDLYD